MSSNILVLLLSKNIGNVRMSYEIYIQTFIFNFIILSLELRYHAIQRHVPHHIVR